MNDSKNNVVSNLPDIRDSIFDFVGKDTINVDKRSSRCISDEFVFRVARSLISECPSYAPFRAQNSCCESKFQKRDNSHRRGEAFNGNLIYLSERTQSSGPDGLFDWVRNKMKSKYKITSFYFDDRNGDDNMYWELISEAKQIIGKVVGVRSPSRVDFLIMNDKKTPPFSETRHMDMYYKYLQEWDFVLYLEIPIDISNVCNKYWEKRNTDIKYDEYSYYGYRYTKGSIETVDDIFFRGDLSDFIVNLMHAGLQWPTHKDITERGMIIHHNNMTITEKMKGKLKGIIIPTSKMVKFEFNSIYSEGVSEIKTPEGFSKLRLVTHDDIINIIYKSNKFIKFVKKIENYSGPDEDENIDTLYIFEYPSGIQFQIGQLVSDVVTLWFGVNEFKS